MCVKFLFLPIATYLVITSDWIDQTIESMKYTIVWYEYVWTHTFLSLHMEFLSLPIWIIKESKIGLDGMSWMQCTAHYVTFHFENMLFDCFDASIYSHFFSSTFHSNKIWNRINENRTTKPCARWSERLKVFSNKIISVDRFLWSHKSMHIPRYRRNVHAQCLEIKNAPGSS